jgi:hypothetical protein
MHVDEKNTRIKVDCSMGKVLPLWSLINALLPSEAGRTFGPVLFSGSARQQLSKVQWLSTAGERLSEAMESWSKRLATGERLEVLAMKERPRPPYAPFHPNLTVIQAS